MYRRNVIGTERSPTAFDALTDHIDVKAYRPLLRSCSTELAKLRPRGRDPPQVEL